MRRKTRMAIVAIAILLIAGCVFLTVSMNRNRKTAMQTATRRAQELGYSVQEMRVECTWKGDAYVVLFLAPLEPPQLGGDLTIEVDSTTGEVRNVMRGQ